MTSIPIAIVDDNPAVLKSMGATLSRAGFDRILSFQDPCVALEAFKRERPGVLLVDYLMPGMDGVAMLQAMQSSGLSDHVPIAMVSSGMDLDSVRLAALQAGALDILPKTIDSQELTLRVRNLVRLAVGAHGDESEGVDFQPLFDRRRRAVLGLHGNAAEEGLLLGTLGRMAAMSDEPGKHCARVAQYAAELGAAMGLNLEQQELLRTAAPLHDIGMLAVPVALRQRATSHTNAELVMLSDHTRVGYDMLRDILSPTLQLAAEIALNHHEQWDGSGYPRALMGDDIPLAGRIVALADSFDLLMSASADPLNLRRSIDRAVAVIRSDSGHHFDPLVVRAFNERLDNLLRMRRFLEDPPDVGAAAMRTGLLQ